MRGSSCRGGPILSASSVAEGPPVPRLRDRPSSSVPHPRRAPHLQISNRDTKLLETPVAHRKQRTEVTSNRDKTRVFNTSLPVRPRLFKRQAPSLQRPELNRDKPRKSKPHPIRFAKLTHSSHSRPTQPFKTADKNKSAPPIFVSVRKKSALCFLQLTEILIEPLFRLDIAKFTRPQPSLLGGLADRKEVS